MSTSMRGELRAYLTATARRLGPKSNGDAVRADFLPKDDHDAVIITADGHHEMKADFFVLDQELGSVGIVHCLGGDGESGTIAEEVVRGWVEDAAHLRHLMAMRRDARRVMGGRVEEFLPTVELVFILDTSRKLAEQPVNNTDLKVIRGVLRDVQSKTELLHAIGVNLGEWSSTLPERDRRRGFDRGFAWLLGKTREWLHASPQTSDIPSPAVTVGSESFLETRWETLWTRDFRVAGKRRWKRHIWQHKGPTTSPLHVIHGPNGTGKSSLAEAFEVAVTGRSTRLRQTSPSLGDATANPLIWGGSTRFSKGVSAEAVVTFKDGGEVGFALRRDMLVSEAHPKKLGSASPNVMAAPGESFRFDEVVCDRLTSLGATERMDFWLRVFFQDFQRDQSKRLSAEEGLELAGAMLLGDDPAGFTEEVRARLKPLLQEAMADGSGMSWVRVLSDPVFRAPGAFTERISESSRWSRVAPDRAGIDRLRAVLGDLASSFDEWQSFLDAEFGYLLGRLGKDIFGRGAVQKVALAEYQGRYRSWLGEVAQCDLLAGAVRLAETLEQPLSGVPPILTRCKASVVAAEIAAELAATMAQRHASWKWLMSRTVDSKDFASGSQEDTQGLDEPELDRVLRSVRTGMFEPWLLPTDADALAEVIRSRRAVPVGQLKVGDAAGWTDVLVARHRDLAVIWSWMGQPSDARSWAKQTCDALDLLVGSLDQLAEVTSVNAEEFVRLTGEPFGEALRELVELMTPSGWAYDPIKVTVKPAAKSGEDAVFDMTSRGMQLMDVLNTAERNAVALGVFLLCAPKVKANRYRVAFLDDPFQNMDELTVTITARALSKLLRLMGSTGKYPGWEFVLLLHGADDCERVVQEVPSVFYRIPWNSPDGAAGTGAGASAGDVEHVRGVGSTRADLFDCVTFMGLEWDERLGLVDPKAKAGGASAGSADVPGRTRGR